MENELGGTLLFLILLLVVNSLIIFIFIENSPETIPENITEVCFEEICFKVEVMKTFGERERGLMNVEFLPEDEGMLFIFEEEEFYNFWMKDTLIPLDIIWIDKNLISASIVQNAVPCVEDPCDIYAPHKKALYVLEINSGIVKNKGIGTREKVVFK